MVCLRLVLTTGGLGICSADDNDKAVDTSLGDWEPGRAGRAGRGGRGGRGALSTCRNSFNFFSFRLGNVMVGRSLPYKCRPAQKIKACR